MLHGEIEDDATRETTRCVVFDAAVAERDQRTDGRRATGPHRASRPPSASRPARTPVGWVP